MTTACCGVGLWYSEASIDSSMAVSYMQAHMHARCGIESEPELPGAPSVTSSSTGCSGAPET
jgi:hypothetical protein